MVSFGYFVDFDTPGQLQAAEDYEVIVAAWVRNSRDMRIVKPARFVDPDGISWDATVGDIVNGLSIPRFFRRIFSPYKGKSREASVFHDVYCGLRTRPSKQVHRMFYYALRANKVGWIEAYTMWICVRGFGPRFKGT